MVAKPVTQSKKRKRVKKSVKRRKLEGDGERKGAENGSENGQTEPEVMDVQEEAKVEGTTEGSTVDGGVRKRKWTNRQRVLVFCGRGASFRDRHLMNDLKTLMPHTRGESKLDKNTKLPLVNEIAEMKNCSKCIYLENRKRRDLYMWMANIGTGPSVKLLVHNVHTMEELRLSGNCLKASRPLLSFDSLFDQQPHLQLIKQLFIQTFGTPNYHPRSQPFIDHVFTFSLTPDGRIWFRNFQIVDAVGELQEIGPRMVLEVIKVFAGSFEGAVLYENADYQSPNAIRRQLKLASSGKYVGKLEAKKSLEERQKKTPDAFVADPLDDVFDTERPMDTDKTARSLKRDIERKRSKKKKKNSGQANKRSTLPQSQPLQVHA